MATRFNREKFFTLHRAAFGSLNQGQVDGLNFLLDKLEQDTFSLKQTAYILATIHHETGVRRNGELQTFQPIKELRERSDSPRRANQDRYWLTGYYGRGLVQITWEKNYQKFGIADTPDKALDPETAYEITSRGMREGLFTGKKLADYINGKADYRNARKIINGLDKADEIAAKARKYESILSASQEPDKPEDVDKGVTTSTKSAEETAGTPPPAPAMEVKASGVPFLTRLTSLSVPAGVVSAIGAVIAFAKELPPYAWIAFSAIIIAGMVIGYLIWREGKKEAHERTKIVLAAAADPEKNNLRLV